MKMSKPYVALVGRPNTGKSTLFNKLAGRRISIVDDTPGVTRDRIITEASWLDTSFYLIDTGGIEPENKDEIISQMRRQANTAMEMADVVVFIADAKEGITAADEEIADLIRKNGINCILAVNKTDSSGAAAQIYDFYSLSLGDPMPISAEQGLGLGDLLDEIVSRFPESKKHEESDEEYNIAVIGKPNVGKSTLINAFLGEERVIVSPVAGTTRDAIDTLFIYEGQLFTLIDTAGIKRKSRSFDNIDYYSSLRAAAAIERSDVCLLLIDASAGVTDQDAKIASAVNDAGKALVIVVNKWDLIEKETNTMAQTEKAVKKALYFVDYAPVVFISALDNKRVGKLMPKVKEVLGFYEMRINTGLLNEVTANALSMNPPPSKGGRHLKIYYASQVSVKPPTVVLFVNDSSLRKKSYDRYLTGKLRDAFKFTGTPIRLVYRDKSDKE